MFQASYSKVSILLSVLIISSCQQSNGSGSKDERKNEVMNTEKAFSALSSEKGVQAAFRAYAADDVVLLR